MILSIPAPGVCVWLTGLSGSGKTTTARKVIEILPAPAGLLLDGDEIRATLSPGLGFIRADREINIARVAVLARDAVDRRQIVPRAGRMRCSAWRHRARRAAHRRHVQFVRGGSCRRADVTMPQDIPFGRWLTSMYETIGVTDLIASTPEDYVRLALRLASDADWKAGLAARIKAQGAVFVENPAGARELETFLRAAVAAAHDGDPPRHWKDGRFGQRPAARA